MSLKNIIVAAAVAVPFAAGSMSSLHAADADKAPKVERIDYMAKAIAHLLEVREAIVHDMKTAKTEDEALEAAKNIGHIGDAIETLHAVEHMHSMADKK